MPEFIIESSRIPFTREKVNTSCSGIAIVAMKLKG
jgi:hypothetical protein